jgi:multidrug efflux pump subunit AcrA (membrane-fusion protein)
VLVLRGDRVKLHPVTVGPQAGADVQVLGGLGPGERVVTGSVPLADGDRVRVREKPGS